MVAMCIHLASVTSALLRVQSALVEENHSARFMCRQGTLYYNSIYMAK